MLTMSSRNINPPALKDRHKGFLKPFLPLTPFLPRIVKRPQLRNNVALWAYRRVPGVAMFECPIDPMSDKGRSKGRTPVVRRHARGTVVLADMPS